MSDTKILKMTFIGGAAAVATSFGTSANADGFSGAYAGLSAGAAFGDTGDMDVSGYGWTGASFTGQGVGGFAGYNFSSGNMVYGAEISVAPKGIEAEATIAANGGDYTDYLLIDSMVDLRGRVGYVFGNALVYGALGVNVGQATLDTDEYGEYDSKVKGASFGFGLEVNLSDNMFIGADYTSRVLKFDDEDVSDKVGKVSNTKLDTASVRIGMRF